MTDKLLLVLPDDGRDEMSYFLITVSEWGGIEELDESKLGELADKGYLDHLVSLDGREKINDTFTLYDDDHLLIRGEIISALSEGDKP